MVCRRCPHHVRHGSVAPDKKNIIFSDICGLKVKSIERAEEAKEKSAGLSDKKGVVRPAINALKSGKDTECVEVPFPKDFMYRDCQVYRDIFKTTGTKNDVIPTQDIQYSEALTVGSITDLELL